MSQFGRLSVVVCAVASIALLSQPSLATDNAFIQEWARQKAGGQPRLMPEIQKPVAAGEKVVASSADQAPAQQAAQKPVTGNVSKGVTVCNSNMRLGDNTVFYCGAFGNEKITVQSLTTKGWRIVSVWPWRDELQLLAEER